MLKSKFVIPAIYNLLIFLLWRRSFNFHSFTKVLIHVWFRLSWLNISGLCWLILQGGEAQKPRSILASNACGLMFCIVTGATLFHIMFPTDHFCHHDLVCVHNLWCSPQLEHADWSGSKQEWDRTRIWCLLVWTLTITPHMVEWSFFNQDSKFTVNDLPCANMAAGKYWAELFHMDATKNVDAFQKVWIVAWVFLSSISCI